jgi:imidazolonepropionase-like amidohydrolase
MRGLSLSFAAVWLAGCVRTPPPAPAHPAPAVAFAGVEVLSMRGDTIASDQTVIVTGDTITAVGPRADTPPPEGALVIEASGRFLVPGLSDMHVHLPDDPAGQQIDRFVSLALASGITSIRSMQGAPSHLAWRDRAAAEGRTVPSLLLAGPPIAEALSVPQARERVREQHAAGYDEIKLLGGIDRAAYDALLDEAHIVGIRLSGHLPEGIGIGDAAEAGQASVEHLMGYDGVLDGGDPGALDAVAAQLRSAGVWSCPTLAYFEQSPPSDEAVAERDRRRQIVRALARADAPLLVGSDAGELSAPGFAYLEELRALAGAGLSPYEVLRAATVSAAQYRGDEDAGQIVPGGRADLVLLDGSPLDTLDNLAHPAGVMVGGRWLAREDLGRLLTSEAPL